MDLNTIYREHSYAKTPLNEDKKHKCIKSSEASSFKKKVDFFNQKWSCMKRHFYMTGATINSLSRYHFLYNLCKSEHEKSHMIPEVDEFALRKFREEKTILMEMLHFLGHELNLEVKEKYIWIENSYHVSDSIVMQYYSSIHEYINSDKIPECMDPIDLLLFAQYVIGSNEYQYLAKSLINRYIYSVFFSIAKTVYFEMYENSVSKGLKV